MNLRIIFPFILISLVIASCQPVPEKGAVTGFNASTLAKFWTQRDCSSNSEEIILKNTGSGVISKFRVRNFEFSARIKSTQGAEGILSFAVKDGTISKAGMVTGYSLTTANTVPEMLKRLEACSRSGIILSEQQMTASGLTLRFRL